MNTDVSVMSSSGESMLYIFFVVSSYIFRNTNVFICLENRCFVEVF